jgi:glucose-6-phosphate dehydrogenase assembly protein OpcA
MTPPAADVATPDWLASSPASIEDDLRQLWETAARQSPVSHALMSNLVIVSGGEGSAGNEEQETGRLLTGIARRHPARVVLLDHRCTSHAREPQSVRVGLIAFGPSDHRYGVEVISVAVACLDESLPSILRAVTRGDVPTTLWLTGDLSAASPAMPLVEMSRQMVYDSRRWKDLAHGFQSLAHLLDASHPPALVDLAWRRLAPVRRAVATALEPLPFEQRPRPEDVTVAAAPEREGDAWLMWGWLQVKLEWPQSVRRAITLAEGDGFGVRFQGRAWSAEVTQASTSRDAGMMSAIVARDTAGRTVTVSPSQETVVEALSDELTSLSHDLTIERVVRALAL